VPMRVLGCCVMPNHFHLVPWPRADGDLGRWMQWLMTSHVRRHRGRYGTSGDVWQGRFKAFAAQDDGHLPSVLSRCPSGWSAMPSARGWWRRRRTGGGRACGIRSGRRPAAPGGHAYRGGACRAPGRLGTVGQPAAERAGAGGCAAEREPGHTAGHRVLDASDSAAARPGAHSASPRPPREGAEKVECPLVPPCNRRGFHLI